MFELHVIVSYLHIFVLRCSQDFSDQVLTVEPTAECFCFHMFSTSFDSDKFGWFGGPVVGTRRIDGRVPFTICQPFPGFWHKVDTTSTRVCGWGGVGHVNVPCTLHTLLMFRSLQDVGQGLGWGGAC